MAFLDKLFCKHQWESHKKTTYNWEEKKVVHGTDFWFNPLVETIVYQETVEILICSKCGKITKIKY